MLIFIVVVFQLCDYLLDTIKKDKFNQTKDKTHTDLVEAEKMLNKWASPPVISNIFSTKAGMNHQTIVKEEKDLRPGQVEKNNFGGTPSSTHIMAPNNLRGIIYQIETSVSSKSHKDSKFLTISPL